MQSGTGMNIPASWVSTVGKVDCVIPASGVLHTFCLLKDSMVEWEAVGIHWGKCKLPKHCQRSRRGRQGSVSVEYKIWGVGWQEWLPRSQKKVMPSSSNKCVTKAKLEDISSPTSEKHEIRVCYAFASFAFFDFKSGSWFSGGTPCFASVAPCRIQMLGSETMACGAESIMRNEDCMVVQLPFCVMHLELRAMGEPSYSPLLNPALLSLEQMFC